MCARGRTRSAARAHRSGVHRMSAPGSSAADVAADVAAKVERFVRETVFSYERDPRFEVHGHGPSDTLVAELRAKPRGAGVLPPPVRAAGTPFSQRPEEPRGGKEGVR